MAGNTNPNSIGDVPNFVGHFTDLTSIALGVLRSFTVGVSTKDFEVITTSTQLITGKTGASFIPLELVISTAVDLRASFAGQNFQLDDGLINQSFAWNDYTPDLNVGGLVRISLAGIGGKIGTSGRGINISNLLVNNPGVFVRVSLVGFYDR